LAASSPIDRKVAPAEKRFMMNILWVGIGGALGSMARYLVVVALGRSLSNPVFPFGTLAVNVIGCFVIAYIGGLAADRINLTGDARVFIFTGILGGFTTFSAFGYETFYLWKTSQIALAFLNVLANCVLGFGAVWLGHAAAKGI
jgi:CrcB protein